MVVSLFDPVGNLIEVGIPMNEETRGCEEKILDIRNRCCCDDYWWN